jgi:hypothetical protein
VCGYIPVSGKHVGGQARSCGWPQRSALRPGLQGDPIRARRVPRFRFGGRWLSATSGRGLAGRGGSAPRSCGPRRLLIRQGLPGAAEPRPRLPRQRHRRPGIRMVRLATSRTAQIGHRHPYFLRGLSRMACATATPQPNGQPASASSATTTPPKPAFAAIQQPVASQTLRTC